MNYSIKNVAKKSVSLGRIMSERSEKIDTVDLIKYYPDGITINDFEKVDMAGEEIVVYTCKEKPNGFIFAGYVLKKMFDNLLKEIPEEELRKSLQTEGLKVKLVRAKTKDGKKELTKVEVVD